jgi:hypothetical protein
MADFKLQGGTLQEKLGHVERVLGRLVTKPERHIRVPVPDVSMSGCLELVPQKFMLGSNGTLSRLQVWAEVVKGEIVNVQLKIADDSGSTAKSFVLRFGYQVFELGMPLSAGARIEVSLSKYGSPCWFCLMVQPSSLNTKIMDAQEVIGEGVQLPLGQGLDERH